MVFILHPATTRHFPSLVSHRPRGTCPQSIRKLWILLFRLQVYVSNIILFLSFSVEMMPFVGPSQRTFHSSQEVLKWFLKMAADYTVNEWRISDFWMSHRSNKTTMTSTSTLPTSAFMETSKNKTNLHPLHFTLTLWSKFRQAVTVVKHEKNEWNICWCYNLVWCLNGWR